MIGWAPPLPAVVALPLVVATLAVAAWAYRRGGWPALLRGLALILVALLLAGPEWIEPARTSDPPVLALVLDGSGSMARRDGPESARRIDAARAALEAVAAAAGPAWRPVRWTLTDQLASGWANDPAGDTGFTALGELIATRPAAVVLASDGADRDDGAIDVRLASAGLPVSALAVGSARPATNAAVRLAAAAPSAFIGQDVAISAVVSATTDLIGRQARLTLAGETRTITLAAELRLTCTRPAGDQAGELVVSASLDAIPEEVTDLDNHATIALPVVDRRLNLVVIEGQPWFDTAAALRAWRRDRQLSVSAYQRLGNRTLAAGPEAAVAAAPLATALASADLVVLGLEPDRVLDAAAHTALAAAVERGAGVLLLGGWRPAGDPTQAWDPLLWRDAPQSSEVRPSAGPGADALVLVDSALLARLPALDAPAPAGLRPLAQVILGTQQRPLIVTGRHGQARTATIAATGWWRWQQVDPMATERLWRQLAKAVASGGAPALAADRDRYRAGMTARLAVRGAIAVTVSDPDQVSITVPVVEGLATVALPRPGAWRLGVPAQQLTLTVEADVRELVDDARDEARLARLAATTGGRLTSDPAQLGAQLARRADLGAEAPRRYAMATAWWLWMPVFTALLATEWWIRRRRHGLV